MSVDNPAFTIRRRTIEQPKRQAGMWEKMTPMLDEATVSPPTPDRVDPKDLPEGVRANPVPHVMAAAGLQGEPDRPFVVELDLMHGTNIDSWDLRANGLEFFLFRMPENEAADGGTFPGPQVRLPRGVIFHSETKGKGPPPHTIHWHGIEPTSANDGVGHCSFEIGEYTYQWQPNHIGHYFYHCHRNTPQHFEFGLYGSLMIQPPDAYFASIDSLTVDGDTVNVVLNDTPIGAGRDGLFRTQANLVTPHEDFTEIFPGFVEGDPVDGVNVPDPEGQFPTDPHAFTVPYDVEVLWVFDDRDSAWSDLANNARDGFPKAGNRPGVDDEFAAGIFNDFRADYWFVTGVPVVPVDEVKRLGATGSIDPTAPPPKGGIGGVSVPDGLIPPSLNSGVSGTQIAVNARVDQTIKINAVNAAYNHARITFPVDVVITAFDGRALGVPPFGRYSHAFRLPANTPMLLCTARRFETLVRPTAPIDDSVKVEFLDSQGATPDPVSRSTLTGSVLQTAMIPFTVTS